MHKNISFLFVFTSSSFESSSSSSASSYSPVSSWFPLDPLFFPFIFDYNWTDKKKSLDLILRCLVIEKEKYVPSLRHLYCCWKRWKLFLCCYYCLQSSMRQSPFASSRHPLPNKLVNWFFQAKIAFINSKFYLSYRKFLPFL